MPDIPEEVDLGSIADWLCLCPGEEEPRPEVCSLDLDLLVGAVAVGGAGEALALALAPLLLERYEEV